MWNPLSISGCNLWLDASTITGISNGAKIDKWNDLSSNANHATQIISDKQPTLKLNELNNRSVVYFDGTNDFLQTLNNSNLYGNPNFTIFVIQKTYSGSSWAGWISFGYDKLADSVFFSPICNGVLNKVYVGYHSTGLGTNNYLPSNSFNIVTWVKNSGNTCVGNNLWYNGISQTLDYMLSSPTTLNITNAPFKIGKTYISDDNNGLLKTDIAELIVYNRALNDTERSNVEKYLSWKWLNTQLPSFMYNKIIIKNNDYIMKYVDNAWINTNDTSDVNLNIFNQYGIDDISTISSSKWKELNKFKVYTYIEDTSVSLRTKLTGISQPQICKMDTNYNLAGIKKINSLNITSNISNNGIVKFMLSFTSGMTWYSYNGTDWIEVNINDLTDCKNNGMTKDILNSIPSDKLESLRNNGKGIRFAYYIEISNTIDIVNVDKLNINVDMEGTWKHIPDNGTVYDYEFKDNTTLKISLYQANTYKINYPQ